MIAVSVALAGAIAIALISVPGSGRGALGAPGAASAPRQVAQVRGPDAATDGARAANGARATAISAYLDAEGTSTLVEHSSMVSGAPTAAQFTWVGGPVAPPAQGPLQVQGGLRAGALIPFDDPLIAAAASGDGTASVTDDSVSCSDQPSCDANTGDTVTLSSAAIGGATFLGWSGGNCVGQGATCTLTNVQDPETDTANYSVTVAAAAQGDGTASVSDSNPSVTCSEAPSCHAQVNDLVTLAAVPSSSSETFVKWTGGTCAGQGQSCSIPSIQADETDTAVFTVTITAAAGSNGTASVTDLNAGCSSQPSCNADYDDQVTLSAAGLTGYQFSSWSGPSCSSQGASCTINHAQSDETDTASFTAYTYTVSGSPNLVGGGTVTASDPPGSCSGNSCTANYGDTVTLHQTTNPGYTFNGWSGAGCTGTGDCVISPVNGPASATANYTLNTYTVSGSPNLVGGGTVTASDPPGSCSGNSCTANYGDTVTLHQTTNPGYTFNGWSGAGCTGTGDCVISPVNGPASATANYTLNTYTVSGSPNLVGGGTVTASDPPGSCSGNSCTANYGDTVTLHQTTNPGYTFNGWSGAGCTGTGDCVISPVNGPASATANYTLNTYTVSGSPNLVGGGTVTASDPPGSCSGNSCTANYGDTVTLHQTTNPGYTFNGWSGAGCTGTGDCVISPVNGPASATANYTLNTYTVSGSPNLVGGGTVTASDPPGSCSGNSCTANYGDTVTLHQTTNPGYTFNGWSGAGCTGTGDCVISPVNGPASATANYTLTNYTITALAGSNGSVAIADTSNPGAACSGSSCTAAHYGDQIQIKPNPSTGYHVGTWAPGGSCTGTSNPCTFSVTQSETDSANFVINTYTITALAGGTGTGNVTVSDPNGVCSSSTGSSSCTVDYGDTVTLNATPSPSNTNNFKSWAGGSCSPAAAACTITGVSAGETDTANFVPAVTIYAMGFSLDGTATVSDPTVNCPKQASCQADVGDTVTVTATATAPGYIFGSWAYPGLCQGQGAVCTLQDVSQTDTETPNFVLEQFEVKGVAGSNGSVTLQDFDTTGSTCSTTDCHADYGDVVTLTATPNTGYHFVSWAGGSCTANPCTIPGVEASETDTAAFAPNPETISTGSPANGSAAITDFTNPGDCATGATTCTVSYGDTIQIVATPNGPNPNSPPPANTGYHFVSWLGGSCSTPVMQGRMCGFAATTNETDTPTFTTPSEYAITVEPGSNGSATVVDNSSPTAPCNSNDTSCVANYDDQVTITATPASGFSVASWSGGGCTGTATTCVIKQAQADATVTVTFALPVSGGSNSNTVFVSPKGNDSNPGTQSQPVASPQRGLAILEASKGADQYLWLAQGSYGGPLALTATDDGVGIYGGFDPTTWAATYNPTTPTTITGSPEALLANGAVAITLQQLSLDGQAASAPSSSAYGVLALGGSQILLTNVAVNASNGTAGANGAPGGAGAAGHAGTNGTAGETPAQVVAACLASSSHCAPVDPPGGAPGTGSNGNDYSLRTSTVFEQNPLLLSAADGLPLPGSGPSAGDGGFGGWGSTNASTTPQRCSGSGSAKQCEPAKVAGGKTQIIGLYAGSAGSTPYDATAVAAGTGGGAGAASSNADGPSGTNGSDGSNGAHGGDGAPATAGGISGPGWTPGNGGSGAAGGPGSGGGGGGGGGGDMQLEPGGVVYGSGNSGGGGGGGGTGGTGGTGGGGGGGSFGLYLDGSSMVLAQTGSVVTSGSGGNGGNGGSGGSGGVGGAGGTGGTSGTPLIGAGGHGGAGGSGGGGGAGGGGAGGPSCAICLGDSGSSVHSVPGGATFTHGSGGSGGSSGGDGQTPAHPSDGANPACTGTCPGVPIGLPAVALLKGSQITTELQCASSCHGTASLRFASTSAAKPTGALISQVKFQLGGGAAGTLHMTVGSGARSTLSATQRMAVQLTVVVTVGHGRSGTYLNTVELTRKLPPLQRNAKSTTASSATHA